MDGKFYTVVECQKVQQPRLAAFMRAKIKNLENGAVQEINFKPNESFEDVEVTKRLMKFSYADGDLLYFMEEETFETEPVAKSMAEGAMKYDNEVEPIVYTFEYINGKLARVIPPTFVVLKVIETDPAVAGDTARNALKNAKLESGLTIRVQMFIANGDLVRIDTRTGEYVERVKTRS